MTGSIFTPEFQRAASKLHEAYRAFCRDAGLKAQERVELDPGGIIVKDGHEDRVKLNIFVRRRRLAEANPADATPYETKVSHV